MKQNNITITGKIKAIHESIVFGRNAFRKRELLIIYEQQFSQILLIQFIQDKCDLLNEYQTNDEVKLELSIKGREWESPSDKIKYFTDFQGEFIELINRPELITNSNQEIDRNKDIPF